ncbi:MAG: hypothetical protein J6Y65_01980 [Eggerthellaceae bacterium]|nr:hypothetical protein [Eggerthellaceae bacterium]
MKKIVLMLASAMMALGLIACAPNYGDYKTVGEIYNDSVQILGWQADDEYFIIAYEESGAFFRAAAAMDDAANEAMEAYDFITEISEIEAIASLPLILKENLSEFLPPQSELNKWIGKTGAEMMADGYSVSGYFSFFDTEFGCSKGMFNYTVGISSGFEEDDEKTNEELFAPCVIKSVSVEGLSGEVFNLDFE